MLVLAFDVSLTCNDLSVVIVRVLYWHHMSALFTLIPKKVEAKF